MTIVLTLLLYFTALLLFSRLTTRKGDGNESFYQANRRSPWYMVAFGMIGASISGVTFISVPGMIIHADMTYMQTCLGFILGYIVVAFVLLPVYYRQNLTTIYTYLLKRLGRRSYKTGAAYFLLSKMTGAAVRFFVVCFILQRFVFDNIGVSFYLTVPAMVLLIWLYTRKGGIKTLVWTDTFQTLCMFTALIIIIFNVISQLDMSVGQAITAIANDSHSRMFVFDDWVSRQNFWKMFLSGIFITIVMTGLDQDMMQKNMTCKSLRDAQKDMCTYGLAFAPANLLFMSLGVLLMMLVRKEGVPMPASGDELLPMFAASGALGQGVVVLFTIGIVAASFSSADSALTSLTTSWCVDIMERPHDERLRRHTHIMMGVVFTLFIFAFRLAESTSVIDAIYILCSYTYGPLLGLFTFGLFTKKKTCDQLVPYICVASPLLCLALDQLAKHHFGYHFSYELLMVNGLITFSGLWLAGNRHLRNRSASSAA